MSSYAKNIYEKKTIVAIVIFTAVVITVMVVYVHNVNVKQRVTNLIALLLLPT